MNVMMTRLALTVGTLALAATPLAGQGTLRSDDSVVYRSLATRSALQGVELRRAANRQSAAPDTILADARQRLKEGDFRPGDLILLSVQAEAALSDTFTVGPDRMLQLPSPVVGRFPLQGVLRTELESRMTEFIGQFVQNPVVRAEPLVRLSIQGEVTHAGYHGVPANAVLADALMSAGGATAMADFKKMRVERDGRTLLEREPLQRAIADGRTVDEMGLRDGDRFIIGRRNDRSTEGNLRFLLVIVSLAGGIYGLSRAVH